MSIEAPAHCPGLIPRSIVHIFEGKTAEEDEDTLYDVRVSYIEIYNEEIRSRLTLMCTWLKLCLSAGHFINCKFCSGIFWQRT
jgi:hypothetical protein